MDVYNKLLKVKKDLHIVYNNVMIYKDNKRIWGIKDESQELKNECDVAHVIRDFKQNKSGLSPYSGEYYDYSGKKRDDYVTEYEDFGGKILRFNRSSTTYLCKSGEHYFKLDDYRDQRIKDLEDRKEISNKLMES